MKKSDIREFIRFNHKSNYNALLIFILIPEKCLIKNNECSVLITILHPDPVSA